jgi:hypothetical protein
MQPTEIRRSRPPNDDRRAPAPPRMTLMSRAWSVAFATALLLTGTRPEERDGRS